MKSFFTVRTLGIFFLLPIILYATGNALFDSQTELKSWGLLLMYLNSLAVLGTGSLVHRLVRQRCFDASFTYLAARVVEAVLLALGIYWLNKGDDKLYFSAYHFAMLVLGLASSWLFWCLRTGEMLPKYLASWAIIGYLLLFLGSALELFGVKAGMLLSLSGGLFELFFGCILLALPRILKVP